MAKKNSKKSKKLNYGVYIASILVVVVIIVALYLLSGKLGLNGEKTVATVNEEKITQSEVDKNYNNLPEEYKQIMTKDMLLDQLINTKLLIQEANAKGIIINESQVQSEVDKIKMSSFNSDSEFMDFLKEKGMTLEDVNKQLTEQLLINTLLEQEILSKIEISDSKVRSFYDTNKELLGNFTYEQVKDQIKQSLYEDLAGSAIKTYISQLRSKAEIIIIGKEETPIVSEATEQEQQETVTLPSESNETEQQEPEATTSFQDSKDSVCTEDEKPIITLYLTSKCAPCDWAKEAFDSVIAGYEDQVIVHEWVLDTGDDLATEEIETVIPSEELTKFKKYNPKSTVPTYVFGCKYIRSGNAYDDLDKEKADFNAVIEKII